MKQANFFIGIDISSETFISSIFKDPKTTIITSKEFSNSNDGFDEFVNFLKSQKIKAISSIICFESTGVYSEKIAYFLFSKKYKIVQEHALKVKRAFKISGDKTDAVDSRQIAEYAYRFQDELVLWEPKQEILEKMKQILMNREFLVKQKTAFKNSLTSYKKHEVQVNLIADIHTETVNFLEQKIKLLESELDDIIKKKVSIAQKYNQLKSVPGVGKFLASAMIVAANEFKTKNYKQMSSYVGIVPLKYESGTSVFRTPRSKKYGNTLLRKLLCLSSLSMINCNKKMRTYFYRKVAEGKPKRVVLNNIANKTIKLCYALIMNNTVYVENYKSINPALLQ